MNLNDTKITLVIGGGTFLSNTDNNTFSYVIVISNKVTLLNNSLNYQHIANRITAIMFFVILS